MRRPLIILLTSVALWVFVGQLNHGLATRHVALFAGGLMITTAALIFPLKPGMAVSAAAGLACDANAPVLFGTLTLLFMTAHVLIFRLRDRLSHDETASRIAVALLANLALFLALSFLQMGRTGLPASAWPRLGADLICSQVFIVLVAPWFFALQDRAMGLARPRHERRG